MASMARSTLSLPLSVSLVGRQLARPSVIPQIQLASSFASSSRVRLDSPSPSISTSNTTNNSTSPASSSSPSSFSSSSSTGSTGSPSLASSIIPPSRPLPNTRSSKAKYRVPPPSQSMGVDNQLLTLTVSATRNNTLLTFSDKTGPIFPTISAGTDKGFKNSQRASYEAAHQAALKMFDRINDYDRVTGSSSSSSSSSSIGLTGGSASGGLSGMGNRRMKVVFQGLRGGQGREAVASALGGQEGEAIQRLIGRVEDRTGIKIGGTRGKRVRRL